MKFISSLFVSVLLGLSAQANDDLAASMEIIGEQFNTIARGIQTNEFTDVELEAVQVMIEQIEVSSKIFPDTASSDEDKAQYTQWMDELMQLSLTLEEQVSLTISQGNQDNSDVIATIIEINELRKQAHAVFKLD
jgi:hypothetical protein